MVVSSVLARPYPSVERDSLHFSLCDLSEIKQGLKEISEGKVVPLNQLEERFGIRESIS